MDQNPIKLVKLSYRYKLLCNVVAQENMPIEALLKTHNIRDSILFLKSAWDELPQRVLQNAWKKIKYWDDNEFDADDNIPLSELFASDHSYNDQIQEVNTLLSKIGLSSNLTLEEIEEWNADSIEEEDEIEEVDTHNGESDIETVETTKMSYPEAIGSVNALIKWCAENNETHHMPNLVVLRTNIVKTHFTKNTKQTTLSSYFKPVEHR